MRRILSGVAAAFVLVLAMEAGAQMIGIRFLGVVSDEEGAPVAGATVRVEVFEEDTTTSSKAKSDKKGRYRLFILHMSRAYKITVEKEGYARFEEIYHLGSDWTRVKPSIERSFTLRRFRGEAEPTVELPPAVAALYEEGVSATYAGDLTTAREKFEAMAEETPDVALAHLSLAKVCMRQGDHEAAASAVERALELEPENREALAIRVEAYRALGDFQKAAEAERALEEREPQGQE